jgi:drug/metabolite transporter (DMT)-like permease
MLLVTVLLWSGNFTALSYTLERLAPLAHSALRFAAGAILFATWVFLREGSLRIARRDLLPVAGVATVGILLNQVTVVYAVRDAGAAEVAMLMATAPLLAAALAVALGHERLGAAHWAGLAVAFAGAALVVSGSGGSVGAAPLRGGLEALATAATWGAYSVLVRPLMERYSASRLSAAVLLLGAAMLLPVGIPQLARQDLGAVGAGRWLAFAFSTVLALVLTNVLWFEGIRRVGASRATLFIYLQPFAGALIALALLHERIGAEQWAGGAVIIAGVVLAGLRRERLYALAATVRNRRARSRPSSA